MYIQVTKYTYNQYMKTFIKYRDCDYWVKTVNKKDRSKKNRGMIAGTVQHRENLNKQRI